ncbi:pimeloyl-ACP methyl ester carboxylesterase [Rhizobium pisi]|uniref:Pimeloyl-ACP methyl ester carboxylesterase n=1 Tax=Rhizobium pisi TaxID=574561 RepID=A0A7W5G2S7_9HYPH|nr:pimeloyl-ACP methyl ester carboxylesterase [Rhizobium pisi]
MALCFFCVMADTCCPFRFRRTVALINRPTLVIAGEHDTVTAASHSELIAATVPGAKLVVLPAVHLSNVEYPAEFMRAVQDFLR